MPACLALAKAGQCVLKYEDKERNGSDTELDVRKCSGHLIPADHVGQQPRFLYRQSVHVKAIVTILKALIALLLAGPWPSAAF